MRVLGLLVLGLVGCPWFPGDLCSDHAGVCGEGGAGEAGDATIDVPAKCDLTKDPKDSPDCVDESVGVFASPMGDDGNAGTKAKPVKTLAKALALASSSSRPRVYACVGTFDGVDWDKAVSLYGQFACGDWSWQMGGVTKIERAGVALRVKSVSVNSTFEDLTLSATTPAGSGKSVIAALASMSTVTFTRVAFVAAAGSDGAKGSENSAMLVQAMKGNNTSTSAGAAPITCNCPDGPTDGAAGGTSPNQNGGGGTPALGGTPPKDGAGGTGGLITCSSMSNAGFGHEGADGDAGAPGTAAMTLGTLDGNDFVPSKGGDATSGNRAQGGGGGGARTGGGGGGGGCGGCGGDKGGGGEGGGASIALASVQSTITVKSSTMKTANGGKGGDGGKGQAGQQGGNPGGDTQFIGCNGGSGGNGGAGGGGAGGSGGSSVLVLYLGSKPMLDAMTQAAGTFGMVGMPGAGGTPGGAMGAAGVAGAEKMLP